MSRLRMMGVRILRSGDGVICGETRPCSILRGPCDHPGGISELGGVVSAFLENLTYLSEERTEDDLANRYAETRSAVISVSPLLRHLERK